MPRSRPTIVQLIDVSGQRSELSVEFPYNERYHDWEPPREINVPVRRPVNLNYSPATQFLPTNIALMRVFKREGRVRIPEETPRGIRQQEVWQYREDGSNFFNKIELLETELTTLKDKILAQEIELTELRSEKEYDE